MPQWAAAVTAAGTGSILYIRNRYGAPWKKLCVSEDGCIEYSTLNAAFVNAQSLCCSYLIDIMWCTCCLGGNTVQGYHTRIPYSSNIYEPIHHHNS